LGTGENAGGVIVFLEARNHVPLKNSLHTLVGQGAAHAAAGFHFDATRVHDDEKEHAIILASLADAPAIEQRSGKLFWCATIRIANGDNGHLGRSATLKIIAQRVQTALVAASTACAMSLTQVLLARFGLVTPARVSALSPRKRHKNTPEKRKYRALQAADEDSFIKHLMRKYNRSRQVVTAVVGVNAAR
jgi:hypothetical protein